MAPCGPGNKIHSPQRGTKTLVTALALTPATAACAGVRPAPSLLPTHEAPPCLRMEALPVPFSFADAPFRSRRCPSEATSAVMPASEPPQASRLGAPPPSSWLPSPFPRLSVSAPAPEPPLPRQHALFPFRACFVPPSARLRLLFYTLRCFILFLGCLRPGMLVCVCLAFTNAQCFWSSGPS